MLVSTFLQFQRKNYLFFVLKCLSEKVLPPPCAYIVCSLALYSTSLVALHHGYWFKPSLILLFKYAVMTQLSPQGLICQKQSCGLWLIQGGLFKGRAYYLIALVYRRQYLISFLKDGI